jgi:UPF0716 protein FxsA
MGGKEEYLVFRRLPLILCLLLAIDFLLMILLWCRFGWKPALAEIGLTTVIGLVVIVYYEWRWSEGVGKRLESEPAILDGWAFEKILLLVAGVVLLIPGVLTDVFGLVLLLPPVRRLIAAHSNHAMCALTNWLQQY